MDGSAWFLARVAGAHAVLNGQSATVIKALAVALALGWLGRRIAGLLRDLPPE